MNYDLAGAMVVVAELVLGPPVKALSRPNEWRYGKQGSLSVKIKEGVFHDFEGDVKGGTLALLKHKLGLDPKEAFEWMKDHGIEIEDQRAPRPNGTARPNGANGHAKPNGHANGAAKTAPVQAKPAAKGERKIVAVYDYLDGDGALQYQVVRFEPKKFAQRIRAPGHPDAWLWSIHKGTFVRHNKGTDWLTANDDRTLAKGWGDPIIVEEDTPHGLFNFPEIREEMLQPADERRTIFVAEGERDCLTLAEWGLLATTNSGGAANWRADHAAQFAGADVVILLDNDKAGRDRGARIAETLLEVKAKVRILDWKEWWPGAPEKADVTDWRDQAGGTKAKFFSIVEKLKPFARAKERRFGRLSLSEIRTREIRAPEYVVDDWLVAREVSFIGGAPQSGKTFLATHVALCIATGRDVLGRKVAPGLVIYQSGEGGTGFLDQRIPAWLQYHNVGDDAPFEVLPHRVDLFNPENDTKALIETIKSIASEYPGVPLRAVFIDTFAKAMRGGDEIKGVDVGKVLENMDAIAHATGAHVCVIHHIPMGGGKLRGHTSLSGDVDSVVMVECDEDTKVRTIKADKIKDGPSNWELRFELLQQVIGHRPDGKEITSCVCVGVGQKAEAKNMMAKGGFNPSPQEQKIFRAFLNAMKAHGVAPPSTSAIPASVQAVITMKQWRDEFIAIDLDPSEESEKERRRMKTAFNRGIYSLTEKMAIKVVGRHRRGGLDDLLWHTGVPVRGFPETYGKTKKAEEEPAKDPTEDWAGERVEF